MRVEDMTLDKDLYLFEMDNVLFPKRDYLVQVYYLFGSFFEFSEGTTEAIDIAKFMTKIFDLHGEDQVFETTKVIYNIDDKYEDNFNRLIANAQIPVKLELFPDIIKILLNLNKEKRKIAILTKGNPVEQLNKLKFIDWRVLDFLKETLKVFFVDELEFKSYDPLTFIAQEYAVDVKKIIYIK